MRMSVTRAFVAGEEAKMSGCIVDEADKLTSNFVRVS